MHFWAKNKNKIKLACWESRKTFIWTSENTILSCCSDWDRPGMYGWYHAQFVPLNFSEISWGLQGFLTVFIPHYCTSLWLKVHGHTLTSLLHLFYTVWCVSQEPEQGSLSQKNSSLSLHSLPLQPHSVFLQCSLSNKSMLAPWLSTYWCSRYTHVFWPSTPCQSSCRKSKLFSYEMYLPYFEGMEWN